MSPRYPLRASAVGGILTFSLLACLVLGNPAIAQDDDDEFSQFRPGLVAEYAADGAAPQRRIDDLLAFNFGAGAPDARILPGPFTATWRGRLLSVVPGEYRLRVFAAGDVSLTLAGKPLLHGDSAEAVWMDCKPIPLSYGFHPLEVKFRKTSEHAARGVVLGGAEVPTRTGSRPTPVSRRGRIGRRLVSPRRNAHARFALRGLPCDSRFASAAAGAGFNALARRHLARLASRLAFRSASGRSGKIALWRIRAAEDAGLWHETARSRGDRRLSLRGVATGAASSQARLAR